MVKNKTANIAASRFHFCACLAAACRFVISTCSSHFVAMVGVKSIVVMKFEVTISVIMGVKI
jgi:hypothetical protein